MAQPIKRRNFLKNSLLATGGIILAANFISCSDDENEVTSSIPVNLTDQNFNQGVASFDPTNSQIIIWSRYTTTKPNVKIVWQLAKDIDFKNLVRQGEVITDASRDYTLAIEIKDLEENLKLF